MKVGIVLIRELFKGTIENNFQVNNSKFTIFELSEFKTLMKSDCEVDKAKFIWFYLYIKSHIRVRTDITTEYERKTNLCPCAFWKNFNTIRQKPICH